MTRRKMISFKQIIPLLLFICSFFVFVRSKSLLLGVHPLDEKYFSGDVIKCKDGSKSFSKDRLNDDFCDCVDGTDEPGTSACPGGKFYCRNVGSTPRFIFSSHVNDGFCDCCDGSDEYDSRIKCPNTCVMGGTFEYKFQNRASQIRDMGSSDAKGKKGQVHLEDLIQKLSGLKIMLALQVFVVSFVVVLQMIYRRVRSKRRRYR